MFNKDRLRIAKELRGLSNTDFADKLSCSTSKVKQLLDVEKEISEIKELASEKEEQAVSLVISQLVS